MYVVVVVLCWLYAFGQCGSRFVKLQSCRRLSAYQTGWWYFTGWFAFMSKCWWIFYGCFSSFGLFWLFLTLGKALPRPNMYMGQCKINQHKKNWLLFIESYGVFLCILSYHMRGIDIGAILQCLNTLTKSHEEKIAKRRKRKQRKGERLPKRWRFFELIKEVS